MSLDHHSLTLFPLATSVPVPVAVHFSYADFYFLLVIYKL